LGVGDLVASQFEDVMDGQGQAPGQLEAGVGVGHALLAHDLADRGVAQGAGLGHFTLRPVAGLHLAEEQIGYGTLFLGCQRATSMG
jgi:hypothetical protein